MQTPVDFGLLAPLEYIALADRERVHTQTLQWLLGPDSPLPPQGRVDLIASLVGEDWDGARVEEASTEHRYIDLLVRLSLPGGGSRYFALENKVKSDEHSRQLDRYDRALHGLHAPVCKVFLTLTGTPPRSGCGWKAASYRRFAEALGRMAPEGPHRQYAVDYRDTVVRLAEAVRRVAEEPGTYAAAVFGHPPAGVADHAAFTAYVERLRLRLTLQKVWMHGLLRGMGAAASAPFEEDVAETRGEALVDIFLAGRLDGAPCRVGVQLQGDALKLFASSHPGYAQATSGAPHPVEAALALLGSCTQRAPSTATKGKEFRSFVDHVPPAWLADRSFGPWLHAVRERLEIIRRWRSAAGERWQPLPPTSAA